MSNENRFIFFGKYAKCTFQSSPCFLFAHEICLFRPERVTGRSNQGFQNPVLEGLNLAGFSVPPLALVEAVFWLDRKPS